VEDALVMYEAALLRWFAALQGEPGVDAQRHLNEYRRIRANLTQGGRT
jgi:hypothetical protein